MAEKSEKIQKKRRVTVELTEQQFQVLTKHAEQYGLGVGPFMRFISLDKVKILDALGANKDLLDKIDKQEILSQK